MPTIVAGDYDFVRSRIANMSDMLMSAGIDGNIAIRGVDTSRFTLHGAERGLSPKMIAEQGSIHKVEQFIDANGDRETYIGIMLVAVLPDGTVLTNSNIGKPPIMADRDIVFHLGVCMFRNGRIFCRSDKSRPFRSIGSQDDISLGIRNKVLEGSPIRAVNPFTTHPEIFIREYEELRSFLGERLFSLTSDVLGSLRSDGASGNGIEVISVASCHELARNTVETSYLNGVLGRFRPTDIPECYVVPTIYDDDRPEYVALKIAGARAEMNGGYAAIGVSIVPVLNAALYTCPTDPAGLRLLFQAASGKEGRVVIAAVWRQRDGHRSVLSRGAYAELPIRYARHLRGDVADRCYRAWQLRKQDRNCGFFERMFLDSIVAKGSASRLKTEIPEKLASLVCSIIRP